MPSAFRGNTAFAHSALLASGLAVIPLSVSAQQPPAARRGVDSILYVEDRGTVSIGDRIRYGQRRFTWTGSTAADDSLQVVLSTETRLSRTAFLEQVQSRLAGLPPNSAFLYVHGYWNGRDDAMQRAAEFKRLVTYPGPAIVFRWPSSDRPDYYTVDREAAWRSRQPLVQRNESSVTYSSYAAFCSRAGGEHRFSSFTRSARVNRHSNGRAMR